MRKGCDQELIVSGAWLSLRSIPSLLFSEHRTSTPCPRMFPALTVNSRGKMPFFLRSGAMLFFSFPVHWLGVLYRSLEIEAAEAASDAGGSVLFTQGTE